MSRLTYLALAGCCLLLAGCSNDAPVSGTTPSPPTTSAATVPSNSGTPSAPTPTAPTPAGGSVQKRCGGPDDPARWITLHGPDGDRLAALVVGHGPVTAVFAHQTDAEGLCGFWPFADWLAKNHGVRSVLVDFCGHGGSACSFDNDFYYDQPAQLALAVDWARAHGSTDLSLVGASLGGTMASVAASTIRPRVDAVVDLSGPVTWPSYNLRKAMPRLTMPTLLALAGNDTDATVPQFRMLLSLVPSRTKRFVVEDAGHGWDLLGAYTAHGFRPTALAQTVAGWVGPGHGR